MAELSHKSETCGAEETRTPDVLLAKEVLYQLSYGPKTLRVWGRLALARERGKRARRQTRPQPAKPAQGYSGPVNAVGVSGLEPEASALSGQCSNQLS